MEILNYLVTVLKTVPTWVWIIALICICVPTMTYMLKRSVKIIGIICLGAIVLFVFPSFGKAFMDASGLTYDSKTKQLTNINGQSITISLPDGSTYTAPQVSYNTNEAKNLLTKVQNILKYIDLEELKNKEINVDELQAKLKELGQDFSEQDLKDIIEFINTEEQK